MPSPQRFLANDRNLLRAAVLAASSVRSIADSVAALPVARRGTATVALTGTYTGAEEATYDVDIVDTTGAELASTPVFSGKGSGTLTDIGASITPQEFTVQLQNAGSPTTYASLAFEGVTLRAKDAGATGNSNQITIDQSGLTFADTAYSLLTDIATGSGGDDNGFSGPGFDWDTKVIGAADNIIPSDAHRIVFGEDTGNIYLNYKRFVGSAWTYHIVPELRRDVPKGTKVRFVTGGRTVTVEGPSSTRAVTSVVTVYDFLNGVKTDASFSITVDGIVANDRTPTGQASRELLVRTDAHAEQSYGSGSAYATGFANAFADSGANTELITATCFAANSSDYPLAHLGNEYWHVKGSVSGDLGNAVTGVPFRTSDGKAGFTIPAKFPTGYGVQKGSFDVTDINYAPRGVGEEKVPICVVSLALGPSAVDQSITLRYVTRPSGDCACDEMFAPDLRTRCLGITDSIGGSDMGYQSDTVTKLVAMYSWEADTVRANSDYASTVPFDARWINEPFASYFTPVSFPSLVAGFETVIALLDVVTDTGYRAAGMTAWDTAFAEFQSDIAALPTPADAKGLLADRYRTRLNWVLISAGLSPLGKTDASVLDSGDGCWRDYGDASYWEVVGSAGGAYAPAFTNQPYYSSRKATGGKQYFSTKEFAFQINVKCPGELKEGDEIRLSIGAAAWGATYQVGDELFLPIVSGEPLHLAGGQDGSSVQTWYVTGSVDGPLASFAYDAASPTSYSSGGLSFTITPGGIPFAAGDKFVFSIIGGHYKWRQNGGSWSADIAIPLGPVSFDSGLSIEFKPGSAPSFVADDVYSFRVRQPWAVSNAVSPDVERWEWSGNGQTLAGDLGSAQGMSAAALALHTLPAGCTITLQGGSTTAVSDWTETLTWQPGPIFAEFAASHTSRYVKFTFSSAPDCGIGWGWLGVPVATELSADTTSMRESYNVSRGTGGLYQGGRTLGKTKSCDVQWQDGSLNESERGALLALVDWVKSNDDEPFLYVPQVTRPAEVLLARINADEVDFPDVWDYNPDAAHDRRFSARLPLSGVWR